MKEHIKSGQYFSDALKWYNFKYIYPFTHRSFILILLLIFSVLFFILSLSIYLKFPLISSVRYSLNTDLDRTATIIKADIVHDNPEQSIADILVRNYLVCRESYDYDNLKNQLEFIQNNSTRIIFRKFYNLISIDNPFSPILQYQKDVKRFIQVLSVTHSDHGEAIINFQSVAKNSVNEIFENKIWQAIVNFNIDDININLPPNSKFNFVVTNYRVSLIEDKIKK